MRRGQIHKYNPRQTPADELRATFVARQGILDGILDELRCRAAAPVNQHFLIIGPRGIGKTNLLLMIRYSVLGDEELARSYLPLQTAEEEYSVASLRDLFTRILELMVEEIPELAEAKHVVDDTRDDDHAAELAVAAVKGFTERSGRKVLLLVDNLDLILDEQLADDAQLGRLRDLLMNESFLALIGATPTYFREVSGYDRPFYNFFRTIDLEEISPEQMGDLLRRHAELDGTRAILDRFDELRPRIKAVHHLTGGNPRLVLMLYQLCQDSELPEVRSAIEAVLDDITPYYKARLETLSLQQRRVMDTFARLGRPATPTELARETRLAVNKINSILNRLREAGFVAIAPQKRRKSTLYLVSERVFRIWHQMRFTASRRRLEFLVEFLRIWYTPEEWTAETDRLLLEYRKTAVQGRLIEAENFLEHLDYLAEAAPAPEQRYQVVDETILSCIESGDFMHAEAILDERRQIYSREDNREQLAQCWFQAAYLQEQQGSDLHKMIESLRMAIQLHPNFHYALCSLGSLLGELAQTKISDQREALFREAFNKYEAALEIKPDCHQTLNNWGNDLRRFALSKNSDQREALFHEVIKKYKAALEIKPDYHKALYNWGNILGELAQTQNGNRQEALFHEAIKKYETALEIEPKFHEALNNWGNCLVQLAQTKNGDQRDALFREATKKYEAVLKIEPECHEALYNWGNGLGRLAQTETGDQQEALFREAFKKYEAALKIKPDKHGALNNWGYFMEELARTKTGEERLALEDQAKGRILAAIEIADTSGAREDSGLYRTFLVHQILAACTYGIYNQEYERVRSLFSQALDSVVLAKEDMAERLMVRFFGEAALNANAGFCEELLDMMRRRGMEQQLGFLEPIAHAMEYWRKGRDPEVLDRLNPEVREVVEEIVERADHHET